MLEEASANMIIFFGLVYAISIPHTEHLLSARHHD